MPTIPPGFVALHGNRAEDLATTVVGWLRANPLGPLEEEIVLVQSNGMAEWFKMEMARQTGICAATRVELPGRFLWRTYRQVLGAKAVPRDSPLDKVPMTWRLMRVLPTLLDVPEFASVKGYLRPDEPERLLQLASQLADLFDQYQNYRADWLQNWSQTQPPWGLRCADGSSVPLPDDQHWQALLWRAVLATLDEGQKNAIRPQLHQQVVQRLQAANNASEFPGTLARRVVVYGMSHLPLATLEALSALGRHSQVLLAIPNPCRCYWGDIIDGRELHRATRQRGQQNKIPLAAVSLEDMHLHAHPLLAAWGRQGRDFIRQLDFFDESQTNAAPFGLNRIDIFDTTEETAQTPLLTRVQYRIRDLEPLSPGAMPLAIGPQDQSIAFHIAHSKVRELEILHDQLLNWLDPAHHAITTTSGAPLQPRDVVVMVPNIESMAPAIRAVFGQYQQSDKRHIPFDIADLSAKSASPIIPALEWLLSLPTQRCRISELLDALEVPALALRFGIEADHLPALAHWMSGAGIRWGLNEAHRKQLGLEACGEQNTAWFGLQRMLLGYASGSLRHLPGAQGWDGIEPYTEIGGLSAELAGALSHLVQQLLQWWAVGGHQAPATPSVWAERGRNLLAAFFVAADDTDTEALNALQEALSGWLSACTQAGFDDPIDLSAFRQAWFETLEVPQLNRRFRAGGITFCTLMPMRAIPFEAVCLLGMNDGDYPRLGLRSDFDLMAFPGQYRPGDRFRQHDDRQLMLEALLSARRRLYISWTGFSVRDNSEQPPSVLVSQLCDYLAALCGPEALKERTTAHPLQPFSRRYFEENSMLHTHASEWRSLHQASAGSAKPPPLLAYIPDSAAPLTLQRLAAFFRNPVKVFFRERLGVVFEEADKEAADNEAFDLDGLENYQFIQQQLKSWPSAAECHAAPPPISADMARLRRSGALPLGGFGTLHQDKLQNILGAIDARWCQAGAEFPQPAPRRAIAIEYEGVFLRDWIDHLHQTSPTGATGNEPITAWVQREPGKVLTPKGELRPEKLLVPWLHSLAAAATASEVPLHGRWVAQDATLQITPMASKSAKEQIAVLLALWLEGMQSPLPLPLKTALAIAAQQQPQPPPPADPEEVYEGTAYGQIGAEADEACLARVFPDYKALAADGRLHDLAPTVYGPLLQWAKQHVQFNNAAGAPSTA